ncbi:hypothetical protein [Pseudoalteromonas lipolytica]|uniref:hypothetical protein n=1 Tax=Pseudoalteromonas lipolytica TaxID=570156 RepID=UPI0008246F36|nr:hypothetical protein [Pseudoalteromonas lipolytica]
MKKKALSVIVLATVVTTLIFYVTNTETSHTNESKKTVNTTNDISSLDKNTEATSEKKTYKKRPFPNEVPDEQLCRDLNLKQSNLHYDFSDEIELKALHAFKNGYSAKQVADAIWFVSSWSQAQDWYERAMLHESVSELIPVIKSLPNNERFLSQYNFVNGPNSSATEVLDYKDSLDRLWADLPLEELNRKITSTNISSVETFNEIERVFSNFPYEILNSESISPLNSILGFLVAKKRIPTAIMLLQRYPGLEFSTANFTNEAATQLLMIIGNEGYEIEDSESYQQLFDLLGLSGKGIYYQEINHPLFSNVEVKNAVEKLNHEGIVVNLIPVEDLEKPEPIFVLNIDKNELTDDEKRSLDKCNLTREWLEGRQLNYLQLDTFESTPFIESIKSSPEFYFCKNQQHPDDFPLIKSQFTEMRKQITQTIANQNTSLEKLDLTTLDVPDTMLPEVKSILGIILARDYLQATSLNEQEIMMRLSNVGLKPSSKHIASFSGLASLKGFTMWLETLSFDEPKDAKALLNEFASKGAYKAFSDLNSMVGAEFDLETELDPFYFFIKNYSSMTLHFGDINAYEQKDNAAFINYFKVSGVKIKPQHLRAMFKRKISEQDAYKALISHFPELKVENVDEFFSLSCL